MGWRLAGCRGVVSMTTSNAETAAEMWEFLEEQGGLQRTDYDQALVRQLAESLLALLPECRPERLSERIPECLRSTLWRAFGSHSRVHSSPFPRVPVVFGKTRDAPKTTGRSRDRASQVVATKTAAEDHQRGRCGAEQTLPGHRSRGRKVSRRDPPGSREKRASACRVAA